MISRAEAMDFKRSLMLLPKIEEEIDALIRDGIKRGRSSVSKSFSQEMLAEAVAFSLRALLWKIVVRYTGRGLVADRRDEWTVTIDLTGL